MMIQGIVAKRALLALLVGVLTTQGAATTPRLASVAEPELAVSHRAGWMVWYEDETFEDCGVSIAPSQCTDEWQPAFSHFVTEAECREISFDYNKKAREEFQCTMERPPAKADDTTHP